jgi:predicted DNA-binding transcriptional regulator AlpA
MGVTEIARRLGCDRRRVYRLAARPDFPRRIQRLAQGSVWDGDEIEAWLIARERPST